MSKKSNLINILMNFNELEFRYNFRGKIGNNL